MVATTDQIYVIDEPTEKIPEKVYNLKGAKGAISTPMH